MAGILFANFARSQLASSLLAGDLALTVETTHGARFPNPGVGEYFYLVLENASLVREVVKVTARAGDTMTIVRGQDNTTAVAWNAGDIVELRMVAAALKDAIDAAAGTGFAELAGAAFTGAVSMEELLTANGGVAVPTGQTGDNARRASELILKEGGAAALPTWATAGRPATPDDGHFGLNTDIGRLEVWRNGRWEWQGARQLSALTLHGQPSVTADIPAGLSELEIICPAISHASGTSGGLRMRVGPAAGVLTTGYTAGWQVETTSSITAGTATNAIRGGDVSSSAVVSYHFKGRKLSGNLWWFSSSCVRADGGPFDGVSGYVDVGAELEKLELALTTTGNFDQGTADSGKAFIYGSF